MASVAASGGGMDGSDGGKGGDDRKRKGVSFALPSVDEEQVDDVKTSSSDEDDDDETEPAIAALKKKAEKSKGGRGLARGYLGKSKSYEKLDALDIKDSKDVGKEEHPLNKKRRLEIAKERRENILSDATSAMKLAPPAAATSLSGSNEGSASMPPAAVNEGGGDVDKGGDDSKTEDKDEDGGN